MGTSRRIHSLRTELLAKAKEATLTAIKVFNDPLIKFKSETFIVLMMIGWTYLLHAHYRSQQIDYRYYEQGPKRRKYHRTKRGAYKYWELERCLNDSSCPIDSDTANNLRFLIGLRHEIEHQMTVGLDAYLSGRYQACILNFNQYLKQLFGDEHGLGGHLSYSLQFLELTEEQVSGLRPEAAIPTRLKAYVAEFDGKLSEDQYNNPHYSYRLFFVRKLANRKGQADHIIEFIAPDSPLAATISKEYWVQKGVEHPKFRAKDVTKAVQEAGFTKFRVQPEHVAMWKQEDAKNPAKGYGVDVQGTWYFYQRWIDRCIELCQVAGDKYR